MNTSKALHGLTTIKLALAAAAVACLGFAFAATNAKAGQGDPFNAEFNYAALATGAAGETIDQLVLDPTSKDKDDNLLGTLKLHGTYSDANGNFTLPKATGLVFPQLSLPVGPVTVDAAIGLADDATGNYDETTGVLNLNAKISLTLGVDDIAALGAELGFPLPGSGSLACVLSPLDVSMSSNNGWPHKAEPYADKANLEEGAIAGAWLYKPDVISEDPGKQYLCDLIGGLLEPVGGLWLGNFAATITDNDLTGTGGPYLATDTKPAPLVCEPPLEGNYPDCALPAPTPGPGPAPTVKKAKITKVKVGNAKVKRGKKVKVTIKVTNKGNAAFKGKIALKSSKKKAVKIAKSVKITVPAGKTKAVKVVVKTTKKAKGKATITAKVGGKTGKGKVTVRK